MRNFFLSIRPPLQHWFIPSTIVCRLNLDIISAAFNLIKSQLMIIKLIDVYFIYRFHSYFYELNMYPLYINLSDRVTVCAMRGTPSLF